MFKANRSIANTIEIKPSNKPIVLRLCKYQKFKLKDNELSIYLNGVEKYLLTKQDFKKVINNSTLIETHSYNRDKLFDDHIELKAIVNDKPKKRIIKDKLNIDDKDEIINIYGYDKDLAYEIFLAKGRKANRVTFKQTICRWRKELGSELNG
ncbi:MAG: hypothetical protein RR623_07540 [Bacilli bacterium]